jgi:tetratricopeptide (TPR) repeat protein
VPAERAKVCRLAAGHLACAEHAHGTRLAAERVETLLAAAFPEGVDLGPAYALRALLALERGRLLRALPDAERAVKLSPGEARGYYVRGRVRLERGDEGALADLETAARLSGRQDAHVLHWLAAAQFRAGRKDDALATQREAVKLSGEKELLDQLRELERAGSASP